MGGTYKATGINLKSIPLGESDRLLTILTPEFGLIRAVAPGARKYKSTLRGRSNLFILNDLLLVRGKSLDKIIQAESLESFPSLGGDLGKLTVGQYLSELVLCQALADHPQPDLFALLREHLTRLDHRSPSMALATLVQATYHLLAYGGVTPQVFQCCLTRRPITPDLSNPNWSIRFDVVSGGLVDMIDETNRETGEDCIGEQSTGEQSSDIHRNPTLGDRPASSSEARMTLPPVGSIPHSRPLRVTESTPHAFQQARHQQTRQQTYTTQSYRTQSYKTNTTNATVHIQLNAQEVMALQRLAQPDIVNNSVEPPTWLSLERVLRHYAQYHFEQPIRSASLIDTCFMLSESYPPA